MLESYFYKGISEQKYVEGDIEAYSLDEAADKLKNDRIIITHLTKVKKKKKAPNFRYRGVVDHPIRTSF